MEGTDSLKLADRASRCHAAIDSLSASARRMAKGQAAMEYLMTYGWALLVIVIVIAILLIINPFSAPQGCRFDQIGFTCNNPLLQDDGKLFLAVTNGNNNPIVLTKIVCTSDKSPTPPAYGTALASTVTLQRQESYSLGGEQCLTQSGSALSLSAGTDFAGKVWVFYKNEEDDSTYPDRIAVASVTTKAVPAVP